MVAIFLDSPERTLFQELVNDATLKHYLEKPIPWTYATAKTFMLELRKI